MLVSLASVARPLRIRNAASSTSCWLALPEGTSAPEEIAVLTRDWLVETNDWISAAALKAEPEVGPEMPILRVMLFATVTSLISSITSAPPSIMSASV